jgi:hypothetical protein
MQLSDKKIQSIQNLVAIELAITDAIDTVCKSKNYQVTYVEINTALTNRLSRNLKHELDDYCKEEEE